MARWPQRAALGREPHRSLLKAIFDGLIRRLGVAIPGLGADTAGDATINSPIGNTGGASLSLVLTAGGDISLANTVTLGGSLSATAGSQPRLPFRVHASPVDYRTSNTYSYTAQGSSLFRTIMKPVPAPSRLTPTRVTVDTLTTPPAVTVTS